MSFKNFPATRRSFHWAISLSLFAIAAFRCCAEIPSLILPPSVVEGAGILTNAGKFDLGVPATSNIIVTLHSTDPELVTVAGSVTIPSGQSNALFNLTIGDNSRAEGDRVISVEASFGNQMASAAVTVIDNDPYRIRFSAVPVVVDTNTGFGLTLVAENADGSVQTNFNQRVTFEAESLAGLLPMEPVLSDSFVNGQRYITFRVAAPGRAVRIRASEYASASGAFTVTPPNFYSPSQPVADIVWHAGSQTLLASVPAIGGTYSNRLIAIDPVSGLVTNSYPVGYDPGQMEISPNGGYLYVAISNATVLQRFDLNTRTAGLQFKLSPSVEPVRFASDFCVPPGMADTVVVAARDRDFLGNISSASFWRYNSGAAASLPNFNATGNWQIESLDNGTDVLLSPNLARGSAANGNILATSGAFAEPASWRAGQIYSAQGGFYSLASLELLGNYPGVLDEFYHTSLIEVDSALRRVIFLTGYFNYGSSFYNLREYDRDLRQPLFQLAVPHSAGAPIRFLRCGSSRLAYVTANNMLWFIRTDAVQPAEPAADLALSILEVPPIAIVRSNFSYTLSLSNRGPGIATSIRVTNNLPVNATIVQTTGSTGSVVSAGSAFTWNVPVLAMTSNATLQVTLQFNNGGWQTNAMWALGFEADPVFTNNHVILPIYAQLPPETNEIFLINQPTEDVVYDPVRDRLILSVSTNSDSSQMNGLAVFNPYTGLMETFSSLGKQPARMARSDNGQYLYVSLKQDALVRRLTLPTLAGDLEFSLGTESWNGVPQPYYAGDMAVVPGEPGSVAVWRVRSKTSVSDEFGRGIAVYDEGVLRGNVTDSGGNWAVEFDTGSGTLFGYNSGNLRRCLINANGVSFAEQFPTFYGAGPDIKYAAGEFFTTAGRAVQTDPFAVEWLFAGAENAVLVEPDDHLDRVFFLVQDNGWKLKIYEITSRRRIGSIPIPNVSGTPSSLIRWGTNGLAFRTSAAQLYIIRSPLVQPAAAANLVLAWHDPGLPVNVGTHALVTLSVTNMGPSTATGVQITNSFSTPLNLSAVVATAGNWSTNGGVIVWTIPMLESGTYAEISFEAASPTPGVITAVATAYSNVPDPFSANNQVVGGLVFGGGLTLDKPLTFALPANDIVWSPSLGKLLLTANGDFGDWGGTLVSVDPACLRIQFQAALGQDANRLAVSRDDAVLYAGVDFGVSRIAIPGLNVTDRFLVQPLDPRSYVYDLEVAPGSNQLVVVGSKTHSNNTTWIGAYDNGDYRKNIDSYYSLGIDLAFGDSATMVFGKDYNANGFRRYGISPEGLTLLDTDTEILPTMTPMELAWGAGKFYSSSGHVIDPLAGTLIGTIPGIPAGSKVIYDAQCDRVFFFSAGSGPAVLRAFDAPTLLPVGSRILPGISGAPTGFVRWGLDGFATTLNSGQTLLFRSGLVATNSPADVSVSTSFSPPPYFAGSNIVCSMLISNAGPNPATDIGWLNAFPSGTILTDVSATQGSVQLQSNSISGVIPSLPTGASTSISFTLQYGSAGILTNQATAIASSVDPGFTNNFAAANLWIQSSSTASAVTTLTLPVGDLERDPVRPLLYACFGSDAGSLANSIVVIDPNNGLISSPLTVGSNPGKLAASPDGQFLYVALDGEGVVQKRTLPDLRLLNSFPVPQGQSVIRMVVSPTNANMVVIRRSGGKTSLHLDGVKLPGDLSPQDLFAFSETTGSLFGCVGSSSNVKLYRLNTDSDGLSLLEGQPGKQSSATDLKSSGGLLFFNRGMVVNPNTTRVTAIMPVPVNSVVEPDAGCGRVFYLTPSGSTWTLRAFDIGQAVEVGSLAVPALASAPRRLVRWGDDGLAFFNTSSQLVLVRGRLIPTNGPIDVALKLSLNVLDTTTNDLATATLQVTNRSAQPATGVIVTQTFSSQITNVVLVSAGGSATYTNGGVIWNIGNMAGNSGLTLSTSFRPRLAGTLTVSAMAAHALNDSFWGNNTTFGTLNVLGSTDTNVIQLRVGVRDLVYDALRNLIYATVPASNGFGGNLVAAINPVSGEMERAYPAGSEPNQITLSDNNRFLYVAQDGAVSVKRFDLQGTLPDLVFPLGTNDLYFAIDLESQSGEPETIAASLGSYNFAAPYPSSVAVYDSGIARPALAGPAGRLAFAADCLFGTASPGVGTGLVRMWPTNTGFITETMPAFSAIPNDIKFSNGRLYSAAGQVIDPFAPALIGSMTASGPQTVDADLGREFFLTQQAGVWQLRGFDLATLRSVSTQTVAGVQGTPSGLIRCGADRLAFRTSANQLFVVRSPAASINPLLPINLVVGQSARQDFMATHETLRFAIAITNRGFSTASNVLLAVKPPSPVKSVSIQAPEGSVTNSGTSYVCALGSLPAGQHVIVVVSAEITNTLVYSNFVSVTTSVPETSLTDNRSLVSLQGIFFQRSDTVRLAASAAQALVYDPQRDLLIAGLSAPKRLELLSPENAVVQNVIPLEADPTCLALSDDCQFLYVGSSSTTLVQRVNLPTREVDFSFQIPVTQPLRAMRVLPGQPHALAISCTTFSGALTAIFDDGVPRPDSLLQGFTLLDISDDGKTLYGYDAGSTGGASPDVFRMNVNPDGLTAYDFGPSDTPWGQNTDWSLANGLLYFGNGDVMNPGNWSLLASFPAFNYGQSVEINTSANIAIFAGVPDTARVAIYDLVTRQLKTSIPIPGVFSVANLTQCGADRIAFTTGSSIAIVRSSGIPSADLSVRAIYSTNTFMSGATFSVQLVVSNAGPATATGVVLANSIPSAVSLANITSSEGGVSTNGNMVTVEIGSLAANATASVSVALSIPSDFSGWVTNAAAVFAAAPADPIQFNSSLSNTFWVSVPDSDLDGIPNDWETIHGLNPILAEDAALDSDSDGLSNLEEFQAQTDPHQFDPLTIAKISNSASGYLDLTIQTPVGTGFTLETSTDLINWKVVGTFRCETENTVLSIPVSPANSTLFYRLAR